jgi:TonB family protein
MVAYLLMYLLKVNLALGLLVWLYTLLVKRDTFLCMRRIACWFVLMISWVYPLLYFPSAGHSATVVLPEIVISYAKVFYGPEPASVFMPSSVYLWIIVGIYAVGVSFFLGRMFIRYVSLFKVLLHCTDRGSYLGFRFRVAADNLFPFSFFRCVVIPRSLLDKPSLLRTVLAHEYAHVRSFHSFDLLFCELNRALCWFNPAAWLLCREVKALTEFQADRSVLSQGYNAHTYQVHLLQSALSSATAVSYISNFSVLPLKKRIAMMNQKQSRSVAGAKYLFLLPATAMLLMFNHTDLLARTSLNTFNGMEKVQKTEVFEYSQTTKKQSTVLTVAGISSSANSKVLPAKDAVGSAVVTGRSTTTQSRQDGVKTKKASFKTPNIQLDEEVYREVDEIAQFPVDGGPMGLLNFIRKEMSYPADAQKKGIQGIVVLEFVVSSKGDLVTVNVMRSVDPLLDQEALRILKLTQKKKWKPAIKNNVPVAVKMVLPIRFQL